MRVHEILTDGWTDFIASKLIGKSELEKINDRRKKLGYEPLLSLPKKEPVRSFKDQTVDFLNKISPLGAEGYGEIDVNTIAYYIDSSTGLIDATSFAHGEAPNAGNLFFHGEWEEVLHDFAEQLNLKISAHLKNYSEVGK